MLVLAAGLALLAFGCGGGSSSGPPPPPPPPLTVSSLSPIVTMQNSAAFTLTVDGTGFSSSDQVLFKGSAKTTMFVSSTTLSAQIATSDITAPGTFLVAVQSGSTTTSSLNFFVVPTIAPQAVAVTTGVETPNINIAVPSMSPTLSLVAIGTGSSAGATGVTVSQGGTANLFIVGKGIMQGTFYVVSGDANDVTVTQPVASNFQSQGQPCKTMDGLPCGNVSISVGPTAVLGARNLLVTNPAGEISVFPGAVLITAP